MVTQVISVLFYDKKDKTEPADYYKYTKDSVSNIESVTLQEIRTAFESQYRGQSFRAQDYEFSYETSKIVFGKSSEVWISITENSKIPLDNNAVKIFYRKCNFNFFFFLFLFFN